MEYLMTYGWALLVIFLVIAVLSVINQVSTPSTCRFDDVGFGCPSLPALDTGGKLYLRVVNSHNNGIVINAAYCTTDKSAEPSGGWESVGLFDVPRGDMAELPSDFEILCKRPDGSSEFAAGEDFSGRLWLRYRNSEDPPSYPDRTASAILATKAVQAG